MEEYCDFSVSHKIVKINKKIMFSQIITKTRQTPDTASISQASSSCNDNEFKYTFSATNDRKISSVKNQKQISKYCLLGPKPSSSPREKKPNHNEFQYLVR